MKLISVVTPCYNEEENVHELCRQIKAAFEALPQYDYEHILIDDGSKDNTAQLLRELAAGDPRVKVIILNRNFGHIRTPFHAMLQAGGDAVIVMASDLQDPPELIPQFLEKWEEGYKIVVGQKTKSEESPLFFAVRKGYYRLVDHLSDVKLLENVTGFGLYDRQVMAQLGRLGDAYPYLRGLISELGYSTARIAYTQPQRRRGISSQNFYRLYDMALLGITSHSKVPLRLATMLGFALSILSFLLAVGYIAYKLLFWNRFDAGVAPLVIGLFFIASVQLFFIGIIGEYIGFIHTQVLHRPLVVENERINFATDKPAVQERRRELFAPMPAGAVLPSVERTNLTPL